MNAKHAPTQSVLDSTGAELDAQFSIESDGDNQFSLVFESGGGPDRNRDYGLALEISLERLGRAQATVTAIEVISREAMARPLKDRVFEPEGYKLPLSLVGVADYLDLRKKIGAGAAKTAQRPSAKKSSRGNPEKKLRLVLRFKPSMTPETDALEALIRSVPKRASSSGGQGFQQDPLTRMAVEEYAMRQAELHYATWQARRRDKERGVGFDIEFSNGEQLLFVEVKGTQEAGRRVIVTTNEVERAHKNSERSVLFVVAGIEVTAGDQGPVCSGGEVSVYEGWDPKADAARLSVKDYWYELPEQRTARYSVGSGSGS